MRDAVRNSSPSWLPTSRQQPKSSNLSDARALSPRVYQRGIIHSEKQNMHACLDCFSLRKKTKKKGKTIPTAYHYLKSTRHPANSFPVFYLYYFCFGAAMFLDEKVKIEIITTKPEKKRCMYRCVRI